MVKCRMEKMAENGKVTTHSVRSNAPIGRPFWKFHEVRANWEEKEEGGRRGKLFIRERNALHFYDEGVRLRVRALRGLLARHKKMVEGWTSLVSIFPDDTLTGHILQKWSLENSIAWKISREIFNWNGWGVCIQCWDKRMQNWQAIKKKSFTINLTSKK